MSGKSEKDIKTLKINGYDCRMRYGISDRKEYLINDCLNDCTAGRTGLLRILVMGIYGPNFIPAFGTFTAYYIKAQYDFVENVFVFAEINGINNKMRIVVTADKPFTKKQEIELNTTLVKLFTNQILKNINDSEYDIQSIDFEIFKITKKALNEKYRNMSDELPESFDFCMAGDNRNEYLKNHLTILRKCNHLDNFMKKNLKAYPDLRKFFMTDELLGEFEKYEKKCVDLFEKVKKSSDFAIKKSEN